MSLQQAGEVLRGSSVPTNKRYGRVTPEAGQGGPHVVGVGTIDGFEAEGTRRRRSRREAGDGRVVEGRLRRAEDGCRVATHAVQAGREGLHAVREQAWVMQEGQIVQRHDERRWPRRDDDGRRVDDVDRARRPLDGWPAQPSPAFVEGGA